jgi:hypothetical protein
VIELVATNMLTARAQRRQGRRKVAMEHDHVTIMGLRQLGLSGFDPRPDNQARREMRSNTQNRSVAAHIGRMQARTTEADQPSPADETLLERDP